MNATDSLAWLAEHGDYLFRFARARLWSDAEAEDAVQETLLAALSAQYAGTASRRTWLTGILRHKIVDRQRSGARVVEAPRNADGDEAWDELFAADGHWAEPPTPWRTPQDELALAQLRRALVACADALPPAQAQVFALRELAGWETGEICKELDLSPTNCWVIAHRARLAMRDCLARSGYGGKE